MTAMATRGRLYDGVLFKIYPLTQKILTASIARLLQLEVSRDMPDV